MPDDGFYLQPRHDAQRTTRKVIAVIDCLFPLFNINCVILKVVHRAISTPTVLGMKTEKLTLYSTGKQALLNLD
jgi:hypothetical protein